MRVKNTWRVLSTRQNKKVSCADMSQKIDEIVDRRKNDKSTETKNFNSFSMGFAGARKMKNGRELMHQIERN